MFRRWGTLHAVVSESNKSQIELLLGWGAFGKKLILFTEDTDTTLIKLILGQWPEISNKIAIVPGMGYPNLPDKDKNVNLKSVLGGNVKIALYRDRDAMTEDEVRLIRESFDEAGIGVIFPEGSDIEAKFIHFDFIARHTELRKDEVQKIVSEVICQNETQIESQFTSQRRALNRELYEQGGSPTNDDVRQLISTRNIKHTKG